MRSGLLHRAAQRIVRGYPQPWRDRYEVEVLDLVDASPVRLHDVVDLARGLVVERTRSLFEPGDRPGLVATLVSLAVNARAVAVALPPVLLGLAAQYSIGPAPRATERSALVATVVLVFVVIAVRLFQKYWATATYKPGQPVFSERSGLVYLAVTIPIAFLLSWSSDHLLQALNPLWMFSPVWGQVAVRRPWQVEMARAVRDLRSTQHQMKWAEMERQRCEDLVAEGSPAPLQEARDAIERLALQQEEALVTLHGLGYRASLRSGLSPDP